MDAAASPAWEQIELSERYPFSILYLSFFVLFFGLLSSKISFFIILSLEKFILNSLSSNLVFRVSVKIVFFNSHAEFGFTFKRKF